MPVYTYRCGSCGVQFERHQFFHDEPLKTCPKCRKKSLRKVITPTKVIFKGSGFYATDSRSPSGDKSSSTEKSASGEKSNGKSAEAKPEKKSESKKSESKSSESSE